MTSPGRSHVDQAFAKAGAMPDVVLTAIDADVIKTYVELGMGIGIVAAMAYDAKRDTELGARSTRSICSRRVPLAWDCAKARFCGRMRIG